MTATQLRYPPGKFTINPVPRWVWWLLALPLILLLLVAALVGTPFSITPDAMLGFPLPSSTANLQMEVRPHLFGEYDAYLRFELPPDGVEELLSERYFQPSLQSPEAFGVFGNAVFGQIPAGEVVTAGQPDWWLSAADATGGDFTLAYRSAISEENNIDGADFAWYIIDRGDPDVAVVYVFVREV